MYIFICGWKMYYVRTYNYSYACVSHSPLLYFWNHLYNNRDVLDCSSTFRNETSEILWIVVWLEVRGSVFVMIIAGLCFLFLLLICMLCVVCCVCYIVLYCTVLYFIVFNCFVLQRIELYCTVSYCMWWSWSVHLLSTYLISSHAMHCHQPLHFIPLYLTDYVILLHHTLPLSYLLFSSIY